MAQTVDELSMFVVVERFATFNVICLLSIVLKVVIAVTLVVSGLSDSILLAMLAYLAFQCGSLSLLGDSIHLLCSQKPVLVAFISHAHTSRRLFGCCWWRSEEIA
jgi:hypothetical protein